MPIEHKSCKISCAHNSFLNHETVLKCCTEHGSDTAVLCAKFQHDLTIDMADREKEIEQDSSFGRIVYIATKLWSALIYLVKNESQYSPCHIPSHLQVKYSLRPARGHALKLTFTGDDLGCATLQTYGTNVSGKANHCFNLHLSASNMVNWFRFPMIRYIKQNVRNTQFHLRTMENEDRLPFLMFASHHYLSL